MKQETSEHLTIKEYVNKLNCEREEDLKDQKYYFETIMRELMKANDEKFRMIEKATDLATENLRVRLDGLNEWRSQNRDERDQYLSKAVYEGKHELLQTQVDELKLNAAKLEGKADQKAVNFLTIMAIIGLALSVVGLFQRFL